MTESLAERYAAAKNYVIGAAETVAKGHCPVSDLAAALKELNAVVLEVLVQLQVDKHEREWGVAPTPEMRIRFQEKAHAILGLDATTGGEDDDSGRNSGESANDAGRRIRRHPNRRPR